MKRREGWLSWVILVFVTSIIVWLLAAYKADLGEESSLEGSIERLITVPGYVGDMEDLKFHRLNCRFAKNVARETRVMFYDRAAASARGFHSCGYCNP